MSFIWAISVRHKIVKQNQKSKKQLYVCTLASCNLEQHLCTTSRARWLCWRCCIWCCIERQTAQLKQEIIKSQTLDWQMNIGHSFPSENWKSHNLGFSLTERVPTGDEQSPVCAMNRVGAHSPALLWSMGRRCKPSSLKTIRDTFWLALNLTFISPRLQQNERSLAEPAYHSEHCLPAHQQKKWKKKMSLTSADWFSHDYKLMLALGPLSAHFRLGESVQRNLICGSTASNAGMLCSVSQGLSSLLRRVLLSVVVGRSVWAPLLPGLSLWYLRLGLHQLKCLSFGEIGFAQGHFPVNGTLRSLHWKSLIMEWTVFLLALLSSAGNSSRGQSHCGFGGFQRLSQHNRSGGQLWPELMQYSHS